MKSKKQNGVTLVALVVTIVAVLILAGITINLTLSEDGIITKAQEAGEKQKIGEYREEIELTKIDVESENLGEITLDKLINKLYEKKFIPDGSAKMLDDGKSAQITTPDGYIFIITINKTDYIGKGDKIEAPPDLQEGDVTFSLDSITWTEQNKNTWTKEDVTVTIQTKEQIGSGLTLQYSLDGSNWLKYTQPFVVKQNTTVYACLTNIMDKQGKYATTDITIIDKLAPEEFTPTVTANTNSVTVDASGAKDAEKTNKYGQSGIGEIWYKIDGGEWVTNTDRTQTSYTYNNLIQNTNYTIQVKVIDNAGNEKESASQQVSTTEVTGIQTGDVTFGFTPSEETNGNVAVAISGNNTGYTLQYKTEKTGASGEVTDWTNYEGAITVTRNQDIYARVVDSTGQYANTTATGTVANIDKLVPNNFTPTLTPSTNSITVTASATDQAKTSDNASSGIKEYSFSINGGSWSAYQASGNYTYNNLDQGTNYTVQVKAKDNAGNETIGTQSTTTGAVITADGNVTFSSPNWNASTHKASITISKNSGVSSSFNIQYQVNSTTGTWTTGTTVNDLNHNDIIYARLWDGKNAGGHATYTVLDSIAPNDFTISISDLTTSGFKVNVNETGDGQTGINRYNYVIGGSLYHSENVTSYTATGLTPGQTYEVFVYAFDNAVSHKQSNILQVTIPLFTSSEIKNVTTTGYDVYIYGVASNVTLVYYPTWTLNNGQDDIIWHKATNQGGGTWYGRINTSDHNYEAGRYATHIYGNVNGSNSMMNHYDITVPQQLVTGISLNKTSTTIAVGKTETLTATVSPTHANNKAVTWTSSNTSVATVSSSGVVTGASAGTATITVAAQDGSGKTATCSVTVVPTLASQITASDYGKTINYSANGVSDWKVFYNDGTNVYIIASDYLPNTKIDKTKTKITTIGTYQAYWANSNFISPENKLAVATLTNTSNWSAFVDSSKAQSATGAPTAERLMESYNAKHNTSLVYTNEPTLDTTDTLYVPHDSVYQDCHGYWLASPRDHTDHSRNVWIVYSAYNGFVTDTNCVGDGGYGLRPVVCLKSSITGTVGTSNVTI